MLHGLNDKFQHNDVTYHVQTEVCGSRPVKIATHAFWNGSVLALKQTQVEEPVTSGGARRRFEEQVRELMLEQHQTVITAIREGRIQADEGSASPAPAKGRKRAQVPLFAPDPVYASILEPLEAEAEPEEVAELAFDVE